MDVFSFFYHFLDAKAPGSIAKHPARGPGCYGTIVHLLPFLMWKMHENAKLRPSPDIQENHHSSHRAGCSELLSVIAVILHFDHIHGKNHMKQHATQRACLLLSRIHLSDSNIFVGSCFLFHHTSVRPEQVLMMGEGLRSVLDDLKGRKSCKHG